MASVNHSIVMEASSERVLAAISTLDGLKSWWTTGVTGSSELNKVIKFDFGGSGFDMKVVASTENTVSWKVVAGPDEWMETPVHFEIRPHEKGCILYFSHSEWKETSDFHHHCSMKWATFLLSMKDYLEQGAGKPYPNDILI